LYLIITNERAPVERVPELMSIYDEPLFVEVHAGNLPGYASVSSCVANFDYDPNSPCYRGYLTNTVNYMTFGYVPISIPVCAAPYSNYISSEFVGTYIVCRLNPPTPADVFGLNDVVDFMGTSVFVNYSNIDSAAVEFSADLTVYEQKFYSGADDTHYIFDHKSVDPLPSNLPFQFTWRYSYGLPGGICNTTAPDCAMVIFRLGGTVTRSALKSSKQASLDLIAKFGGVASLVVTIMSLLIAILRAVCTKCCGAGTGEVKEETQMVSTAPASAGDV